MTSTTSSRHGDGANGRSAGRAHQLVAEAPRVEEPAKHTNVDADQGYELVDFDRYVVTHESRPVGYVEVVPPVFVCYLGAHYPFAVEIAQAYDFAVAVETVRSAALGADSAGSAPEQPRVR